MATRRILRTFILLLSLGLLDSGSLAAAPQAPGERASILAITAGRDTFRQYCAACHGEDGKGHGPVAALLKDPPADLTRVKEKNQGVFPLVTMEAMLSLAAQLQPAHGSEQTPIWGATFRPAGTNASVVRARVANLLAYLESIQEE